jgi:hypothetical protein
MPLDEPEGQAAWRALFCREFSAGYNPHQGGGAMPAEAVERRLAAILAGDMLVPQSLLVRADEVIE